MIPLKRRLNTDLQVNLFNNIIADLTPFAHRFQRRHRNSYRDLSQAIIRPQPYRKGGWKYINRWRDGRNPRQVDSELDFPQIGEVLDVGR